MGNVADKKLAKKMKMLDAAYDLFLEKDVNITAIDEIVKKAGVAKGTFYLYFRDKYDILDQIVIHKGRIIITDAIKEMKNANISGLLPFKEQMWIFTDYIFDYLAAHKELVSLIKKNLSSCITYIFSDENADEFNSVQFIFDEAEKKGISKCETEKILYLITNMISSACCDSILYNEPYTLEEIRPQIHNVIEKVVA